MANFVTTSTLSKKQARDTTLNLFEIIIPFGKDLLKIKQTPTLQNAVKEMELIHRDVLNNIPLKHPNVLDLQFSIFIKQIIFFRPSISSNLQQFWDAQLKMMTISEKNGIPYNPSKYAMINKENILIVNSSYEKAANRFSKNRDDEVLLYALFYAHILRIESMEYSFLTDFYESLKKFRLSNKYDAEEIFSVKGKVQNGWNKNKITGKKKRLWKTDGRAIRDCLGHNLYELDFSKKPWSVKFNNLRKGFEYKKKFTRDSFVSFMNNTDLIYRSSLMMLFAIFALTLCKQHLL